MTWTWSATDLSTNLAKVRNAIGDTNTNDQLLSDEQINYRLGLVSNDIVATVVMCIKDIIAKLARQVDRTGTGYSASRSQQIQHYKDLLAEYQMEHASVCEMFVGGLSKDTEETFDEEEDYKSPDFRLGMDDNTTD